MMPNTVIQTGIRTRSLASVEPMASRPVYSTLPQVAQRLTLPIHFGHWVSLLSAGGWGKALMAVDCTRKGYANDY